MGRLRADLVSAIGAVLLLPVMAAAQQSPALMVAPIERTDVARTEAPGLVTDRPDFTESTDVVARGALQFESGLTFRLDDVPGVRARGMTVPSALLRLGLGRRLELRLGGDGVLSDVVQRVRTSGYSDLEVSAKLNLFDQRRIGVSLAVLPLVSFPTGTNGFTSGGVDPTIKLAWARTMAAGFDLSGNVNLSSISDAPGRFRQHAVSASLGHDLFGGYASFMELYGFSRMSREEGYGVLVDGGISHPVGQNMQWDLEGGRGLRSATPHWSIGVGFVVRGTFGE
jgi:hypothetical protein